MNIMIVGCGRVGSQLAVLLSQEGHNVTIIDKNDESFKKLGGTFNGVTAVGNAFDEKLLRELKVDKQDAFVSRNAGLFLGWAIASSVVQVVLLQRCFYDSAF